jgi:hypothetical protein
MDERYRQLTGKVDAFFERVVGRHGEEMQCRAGCDQCCRTRLTILGVEAAAVREVIEGMSEGERARLREVAAREVREGDVRCAALDDDGRCLIYEGRPVVCRSHGVPIRMGDVIDACRLNFTKRGPAAADRDCVMDQTTVSATLLAIDRVGERRDLGEIILEAIG